MKKEENKEFCPIITLRIDPFATCIPKSTQQEKCIGLCTPRMKPCALCIRCSQKKKKLFFCHTPSSRGHAPHACFVIIFACLKLILIHNYSFKNLMVHEVRSGTRATKRGFSNPPSTFDCVVLLLVSFDTLIR